jgi:hypothetical protein
MYRPGWCLKRYLKAVSPALEHIAYGSLMSGGRNREKAWQGN